MGKSRRPRRGPPLEECHEVGASSELPPLLEPHERRLLVSLADLGEVFCSRQFIEESMVVTDGPESCKGGCRVDRYTTGVVKGWRVVKKGLSGEGVDGDAK